MAPTDKNLKIDRPRALERDIFNITKCNKILKKFKYTF